MAKATCPRCGGLASGAQDAICPACLAGFTAPAPSAGKPGSSSSTQASGHHPARTLGCGADLPIGTANSGRVHDPEVRPGTQPAGEEIVAGAQALPPSELGAATMRPEAAEDVPQAKTRVSSPLRLGYMVGGICSLVGLVTLLIAGRMGHSKDGMAVMGLCLAIGTLAIAVGGMWTFSAQKRRLAQADAALAGGDLGEACDCYRGALDCVLAGVTKAQKARLYRALDGLETAYRSAGVPADVHTIRLIVDDLNRIGTTRSKQDISQMVDSLWRRFHEAADRLPDIKTGPRTRAQDR
jgi:hypothetical protein